MRTYLLLALGVGVLAISACGSVEPGMQVGAEKNIPTAITVPQ